MKTFRKEYGTPENLTTWFIINATMETYEEVTGNYTCFSVEYPEKSSSFYILVSRKNLHAANNAMCAFHEIR